jgi:hypothetical protein
MRPQISGNVLKEEMGSLTSAATGAAHFIIHPMPTLFQQFHASLYIFHSVLFAWWCWSCLQRNLGMSPILKIQLYCVAWNDVEEYFEHFEHAAT